MDFGYAAMRCPVLTQAVCAKCGTDLGYLAMADPPYVAGLIKRDPICYSAMRCRVLKYLAYPPKSNARNRIPAYLADVAALIEGDPREHIEVAL
eukprot:1005454-Rhodomonas_salina.1